MKTVVSLIRQLFDPIYFRQIKMRRKKIEKNKIRVNVDIDESLASILSKLKDKGIGPEDFDKVFLEGDSVGCCGGHDVGEYCYCETSYSDLRFTCIKKS